MSEIKREDQIEKIQSLINKKEVSRRDFFGTIGKVALLSQVVALGAANFLSSCVAFEDKNDSFGTLKSTCEPNNGGPYVCAPTEGSSQGFACSGPFTCDGELFTCGQAGPPDTGIFICNPNGPDYNFGCYPDPGTFTCLMDFTHSGSCIGC